MRRFVSLVCTMFICCQMFCMSSCKDSRFKEEKAEAERIVSFLRESECMDNYKLGKNKVNDSRIEICLWGDCNLQDIFEITEHVNDYFVSHLDSIICTRQIEFYITFFDHEPDKLDYERLRYYASVEIQATSAQNSLEIRTTDTVRTSDFDSCKVVFKTIKVPYKIIFDDYASIANMNGLERFIFDDYSRVTTEEEMLNVLQSVCYYENCSTAPHFVFSRRAELNKVYDEFVAEHADCSVFSD